MLTNMNTWTAVRRALFVEKISQREACRRFKLNFRTIQKIARNTSPGHYERTASVPAKIAPFIPFIESYLAEDQAIFRFQVSFLSIGRCWIWVIVWQNPFRKLIALSN